MMEIFTFFKTFFFFLALASLGMFLLIHEDGFKKKVDFNSSSLFKNLM